MTIHEPPELFGADFIRDPYPTYAWLREHSPVHRFTLPQGMPAWLITRYQDVRPWLNDPRLGKDLERFLPPEALPSPSIRDVLTKNMLHSDPPAHTRLRRLAAKAFTARRVQSLRPRIEEITDELLDGMGPEGETDLIDTLGLLPITLIYELLGVPKRDWEAFRRWSVLGSDEQSTGSAEFETATEALKSYTRDLIADKRVRPGEDLLSDLMVVRDGGDGLSDDELLAMAFLLLLGGQETTISLIGVAVHHLLRNPDQLALLRAEPERLPAAIEEVLRFDGPAMNASMRFAVEDIEIAGTPIPAGGVVFLGLGSASHDPEVAPDGDRFDIRRPARHLAFGHGPHACIGSALARLEGEIAIGRLLDRYGELRLAVPEEELVWRPGMHFRGPAALPVRYRTASR
ncbi:cytochrome P450 family protein [Actinomadura livida]|uniref:Cytochrome P450 n=1 Tax=Actinomadura livida TaxID=79909 RepID=A0A7W7MUP1_9ACTN|nr:MULTISPECIES: cytochrome P450 [Actinomadura]MBB4771743.1 cytochrome P450 [Actinomadura catellatispora]GGU02241.1 cytochrome P450 [Actinomadura livida]